MKKQMTNTEFLDHMMNFSKAGPLVQGFIIQAIEKYSEQCIEKGPKHFDSGFISGQAWITCAEQCLADIKAQYGR